MCSSSPSAFHLQHASISDLPQRWPASQSSSPAHRFLLLYMVADITTFLPLSVHDVPRLSSENSLLSNAVHTCGRDALFLLSMRVQIQSSSCSSSCPPLRELQRASAHCENFGKAFKIWRGQHVHVQSPGYPTFPLILTCQ